MQDFPFQKEERVNKHSSDLSEVWTNCMTLPLEALMPLKKILSLLSFFAKLLYAGGYLFYFFLLSV